MMDQNLRAAQQQQQPQQQQQQQCRPAVYHDASATTQAAAVDSPAAAATSSSQQQQQQQQQCRVLNYTNHHGSSEKSNPNHSNNRNGNAVRSPMQPSRPTSAPMPRPSGRQEIVLCSSPPPDRPNTVTSMTTQRPVSATRRGPVVLGRGVYGAGFHGQFYCLHSSNSAKQAPPREAAKGSRVSPPQLRSRSESRPTSATTTIAPPPPLPHRYLLSLETTASAARPPESERPATSSSRPQSATVAQRASVDWSVTEGIPASTTERPSAPPVMEESTNVASAPPPPPPAVTVLPPPPPPPPATLPATGPSVLVPDVSMPFTPSPMVPSIATGQSPRVKILHPIEDATATRQHIELPFGSPTGADHGQHQAQQQQQHSQGGGSGTPTDAAASHSSSTTSINDSLNVAGNMTTTTSGSARAVSPSSSYGRQDSMPKSGMNFTKTMLSKMREIGTTAVALTRIQRIVPDMSLESLRDRGVDVTLLDRFVDRLIRFANRARGKMSMQELRAKRVQVDARTMLYEYLDPSYEVLVTAMFMRLSRASLAASLNGSPAPSVALLDSTMTPTPAIDGDSPPSAFSASCRVPSVIAAVDPTQPTCTVTQVTIVDDAELVLHPFRDRDVRVEVTATHLAIMPTNIVSEIVSAFLAPGTTPNGTKLTSPNAKTSPRWSANESPQPVPLRPVADSRVAYFAFSDLADLQVQQHHHVTLTFIHSRTNRTNIVFAHDDAFHSSLMQVLSRRVRIGARLVGKVLRKSFTIVHFNDVYHLETFKYPRSPGVVGGASRFLSQLRLIQRYHNPLILFSGDFMSPSLQSVLMKGKHMIDAFNLIGVHYGTFGNHEFDYGLEALQDCIHGQVSGNFVFAGSNTRWIMSNMLGSDGEPLGGVLRHAIATWNGVRVGILGLSENWLSNCNQLPSRECLYLDVFSEGERLAQQLKSEGAEVVIALTHSRLQTDKEMSHRCPSIDLILGGHDHFYKRSPKHRLVKSGEEFEFLTELEVTIHGDERVGRHISTHCVTHPIVQSLPLDPAMETIIQRYDTRVQQRMGKVIGISTVPLDCTEECCRFKEGLLPGFFVDVMVQQSRADFAVLGGAAIAGKAIMPPGDIRLGDVFNWFPNDTRVMTVKIPGSTVKKLLDVMVREVPNEAPSFPHPSAELNFTINTMATPAVVQDIFIRGQPLDMKKMYTVAVEDFVGLGKAKYKFVPKEGEPLVDDEAAEQITYWIINFFEEKRKKRRQSITSLGGLAKDANANRSQEMSRTSSKAGGLAIMTTAALQRSAQRRSVSARTHNSGNDGLANEKSMRGAFDDLPSMPNIGALLAQESCAFPTGSNPSDPNYDNPINNPNSNNNNSNYGDVLGLSMRTTRNRQLDTKQLLTLLQETSKLGERGNETLDILSGVVCDAARRLVPCNLTRLYFLNPATNTGWCLAPVCDYVPPTRVAIPFDQGIYAQCRKSMQAYQTNTLHPMFEDPYIHRVAERHPRGERVRNIVAIPVPMPSNTLMCVLELVNTDESTLDRADMLYLEAFVSQIGALLFLAFQRESHASVEQQQRLMLEASVELLGHQDIHTLKLHDQVAKVNRHAKNIFSCTAELLMLDYGAQEVWTVHRQYTSKKSFTDEITRHSWEYDRCVSDVIDSGLPTLQHLEQQQEGSQRPAMLIAVNSGEEGAALSPAVSFEIPLHASPSKSSYLQGIAASGDSFCMTLGIPLYAPGTEDMIGVLRLSKRLGNRPFTQVDEECGIHFSAFASVAVQTGTEVEALRTGVDRSQLKMMPVHELNRIKWKRGWGSVRSKLKTIISEAFQTKLQYQ